MHYHLSIITIHKLIGVHPICCATYGQGSGTVHISGVRCTGAESSLINCSHSTQHNCSHSSDAGVQCQASKSKTTCIVEPLNFKDLYEIRTPTYKTTSEIKDISLIWTLHVDPRVSVRNREIPLLQ